MTPERVGGAQARHDPISLKVLPRIEIQILHIFTILLLLLPLLLLTVACCWLRGLAQRCRRQHLQQPRLAAGSQVALQQ